MDNNSLVRHTFAFRACKRVTSDYYRTCCCPVIHSNLLPSSTQVRWYQGTILYIVKAHCNFVQQCYVPDLGLLPLH